jgi:hypothetical protein
MRLLIILAALLLHPLPTQAADEITPLDLEAGYCAGVLSNLYNHAKEDLPNLSPPPGSGLPDPFKEKVQDYERNYQSAVSYLRAQGFPGSHSTKIRALGLSRMRGTADADLCRAEANEAATGWCSLGCRARWYDKPQSCLAECPEQVRVKELCGKLDACQNIAQKLPMRISHSSHPPEEEKGLSSPPSLP